MRTTLLAVLCAGVCQRHGGAMSAQDVAGRSQTQSTSPPGSAQNLPRPQPLPDGRWTEVPVAAVAGEGAAVSLPAVGADDLRATAAAVLADLADGSTMKSGPHRAALKRGVVWLRDRQSADTGQIGETTGVDAGLCAYAIAAGCSLSSYRVLQPVAKRAVAFAVRDQETAGRVDCRAVALALLGARMMAYDVGEPLRARALMQLGALASPPSLADRAAELLLRELAPPTARDAAEVARCAQVVSAAELAPASPQPVDELALMLATTALYRVGGSPWEAWSRKLHALVEERPPIPTSTTARSLRCITMTLYYRYGAVWGEPAPVRQDNGGPPDQREGRVDRSPAGGAKK